MDTWLALARFALMAPACALCGWVANKVNLPQITGYLVMGVLMGPHALDLFHAADVTGLWIVDHACLGVIVLAAGAELHWEQLAKVKKQVWSRVGSGVKGWGQGDLRATCEIEGTSVDL